MSDASTFVTGVDAVSVRAGKGAASTAADLSIALAALVQLAYFKLAVLLAT